MNKAIDIHEVFAEYFTGVEAMAYAVSKSLSEGSICLDIERYLQQLSESGAPADLNPFLGQDVAIQQQFDEGLFVTHKEGVLKPFVVNNGKIYLHRYFTYETQIIENITRLGEKLQIITGGPGTGKTYSVGQKLTQLFANELELRVALAAPTGKAAARMNEALKIYAERHKNETSIPVYNKLVSLKSQTIHRLLGYVRNSVFFRHNEKNPLPYDVVVIDEASMIDGALMAKLLNAIGDQTRFYLIGDKDQLASVEAGSVFGDICRAKESPLLKNKMEIKDKNHRAEGREIIAVSKRVIEGVPDKILTYKNNDEVIFDTAGDKALSNELFLKEVMIYREYIEATDVQTALKMLSRLRVLCVTRENDHSVAESNKRIETFLKRQIADPLLFEPKPGFYHNQPIIITKNDYQLGLYNGDVGLVRRGTGLALMAFFEDQDGTLKSYPASYLSHYETVFAMTIHKSQGSEFDHVVVLLPEKQARKLLTRELLYTAVTRAKRKVVVQSSRESLEHCLENTVSRASGLFERISKTEN